MNTMKSTATLVALLALATTAQATPVLHLQIGTDAPTSTATGLDGANLHLKIASGIFTGTTVSGTGGTVADLPEGDLLLQSAIKTSGAGSLTIKLSMTGVASPSNIWAFDSLFSANLPAPGLSVSFVSYADASDTAFGLATLLASTQMSTFGGFFQTIDDKTITPPFSMTEIVTVTTTKAVTKIGNAFEATLQGIDGPVPGPEPIPEPATLTILGVGLLGMGLVRQLTPKR